MLLFQEALAVSKIDTPPLCCCRLIQARVPACSISRIFISHMHGDHVFGLPGLLLSIMDSRAELGKDQNETLHIYGPRGLGTYIWTNLSMSASGVRTKLILCPPYVESDFNWVAVLLVFSFVGSETLSPFISHLSTMSQGDSIERTLSVSLAD